MKIGHIHRTSMNPCGLRFDSSYHLSDGVAVRRIINSSPYSTMLLGEASKRIFHAGRWKRAYVNNKATGIALVGSSDMLKADLSDIKLISKKYTLDIEDKKLQKGWILISCSGTIGNTVFTTKQHPEKLASQDVIRLVPNNILSPGYIYAFLSTSYGYNLLTQGTFGAVIQHIEPHNVAGIPIPALSDAFQQEVDDLIQKSARLREEAAALLEKAKNLLSKYINIKFESTSGCVTATRNIQDIRKSLQCRLDPPALMNNSVLAFEQITNQCVKLGDCNVNVWYPGMFKRAYVKDGLPYMQGSSVFEVNPFVRCAHLAKSRTPKIEELWLKEDLILITCAGSCGQIKLITKEYEDKGAIGSPDIIRIKSNDSLYTSGFLFTYLQMPIVQDYMQSFKYGSVIERFDALRTESIPVIKPTQELSDEITALIKQYKDCTYRAFCAEEEVISMVEQEIGS